VVLLIEPRSASAPAVVLDVPADFHQVPLASDTEDRTAAQLQVLEDMGLSDTGQREALSLYLEALSKRLSGGPVLATAFCAVRVNDHPSTATLTVGLHTMRTADRGLAVLGAAEAMRREGRYANVAIVEVGPHPAVTAVAERATTPEDTVTGEVGATLRELSVLVPVPGHEQAVIVTLSTPCLEDWDIYQRLVLDICRSLRVQSALGDAIS
jgi:hypothetical protein